jgi:sugar phosphate isomerase/epimerase
MMTHKEMTANIRKRLKVEGVKARVDMSEACGIKCIRVFVPAPDHMFSEDDQRTIRTIAKLNRLTRSRGSEIDVERMTDPQSMHFEFHPDVYADIPEVVGRQPQPAYNKDEESAHA